MSKQLSFQENSNDVDFSFVYELDEDSLNLFFDLVDVSITEVADMIDNDIRQGEVYLHSLTLDQNLQMYAYYTSLLDLYTDFELFEECEEIIFILNTLKKYQEKVGNVTKNT